MIDLGIIDENLVLEFFFSLGVSTGCYVHIDGGIDVFDKPLQFSVVVCLQRKSMKEHFSFNWGDIGVRRLHTAITDCNVEDLNINIGNCLYYEY